MQVVLPSAMMINSTTRMALTNAMTGQKRGLSIIAQKCSDMGFPLFRPKREPLGSPLVRLSARHGIALAGTFCFQVVMTFQTIQLRISQIAPM